MGLLLEGIKVGLVLCFLLGPIFVVLIQTGIEKGFRAGIAVASGIWVSDLLFILTVYFGLSSVIHLNESSNFRFYLGSIGSILLIIFGIVSILSKGTIQLENQATQTTVSTLKSFPSLWLKGFLVNTINPFTIFFWIGLMSTVIIKDALASNQAVLYFAGIMGTIILTDSLKVYFAKSIRNKLLPKHIIWFRKISGVALVLFGIALFVRSIG